MSAIIEDALSKLHGSPISDAESDVESVQEERFEKREPLLPGETSILRVVHVHLSRRRYNPNVDGFTFEYDDCSERTAGDASDWLDAKTLALEPGEHIVEVQQRFSQYRPNHLVAVRLRTTRDRLLPAGRDARNFRDRDAMKAPAGETIQAWTWNPSRFRLAALVTRAVAAEAPPTLFRLAATAAGDKMRAEKRACEETGAAEAATLREDFERSVADVYGRARDTLEASEEARRVRELETQLAFAARALHARRSALRAEADASREALRVDYDAGRRAQRADRKRKLDELHDEHQNSAVGGALTLAGSTPLALCRDCSGRFDPRRLAKRRRCVVAGCSSRDNNCGCGVTPCGRCNAPVCAAHAAQHEATCEVEARDRCGYTEDDDYLQTGVCCGSDLRGRTKYECFYCSTVICGQCHEICDGCDAVWCNACLKMNSGVGESCCRDCSFHRDLWV